MRTALACLALVLVAASAAGAASARAEPGSPLERALSPATAGGELAEVLDLVRKAHRDGARPVVVVDIDDTILRWRKVDGEKVSSSPMPGAAAYLRALERAGARIVYLTGRHEESRASVVRLLRALGVPRGARHRLIMNRLPPDRPIVDSKKAARGEILRLGAPVAFFDNDLENVRLFRRQYPRARVVRVAGHSASPDPEPQRGVDQVAVVRDFSSHRRGIVPRVLGRLRWHALSGNRHAIGRTKRGRPYIGRAKRAIRGARVRR